MPCAILSQNGLLFTQDSIKATFGTSLDKFLSKLFITTEMNIGQPKVIKLYYTAEVGGKILYYLPRFLLPKLCFADILKQSDILVEIPNGKPATTALSFLDGFELFASQNVVVDYFIKNVFNDEKVVCGAAGGILDMGAGIGKTFTAAGILQKLKCSTVWITHNEYMQKQTIDELNECFADVKIVKYKNNKKLAAALATPHDIVVIIINTAMKLPASFYAQYQMVVFDEIHNYASEERLKLFRNASTKYMLGLSATTTHRNDKNDLAYPNFCGPVIKAKDIPGFDVPNCLFKGIVNMVKYRGGPEYTAVVLSESTGKPFTPKMLQNMVADPRRNNICVTILADIICGDQFSNVMAFSEFKDHLDLIYNLLTTELNTRGKAELVAEIIIIRGGSSDEDIAAAMKKSRIILTTYAYGSTGISIKRINAEVFLTPRRRGFIQICGRAMRRGSDEKIVRRFYDIIDTATIFKHQLGERQKAYDYYGFDRKNIKY